LLQEKMSEEFYVTENTGDWPSLRYIDGSFEIKRSASTATRLRLVPVGMLVIGFALGIGAIDVILVKGLLKSFSGTGLVVVFLIGLFSAIPFWLAFLIQGLVFPLCVKIDNNRYNLRNGIAHKSQAINLNNAEIVITPMHSRIYWGYAARIRFIEKGHLWPFFPGCIIGTKKEASRQGRLLLEWLRKRGAVGRVTWSGWGDADPIDP
jgi:hypothetical protein